MSSQENSISKFGLPKPENSFNLPSYDVSSLFPYTSNGTNTFATDAVNAPLTLGSDGYLFSNSGLMPRPNGTNGYVFPSLASGSNSNFLGELGNTINGWDKNLSSLGGLKGVGAGIAGAFSIYNSLRNYNLNKDYLNSVKNNMQFQQDMANKNYVNSVSNYNTRLEDRYKARTSADPNNAFGYESLNSYMDKNKLKG